MTICDKSPYIDALITREGGYVDHPADRGGRTRWAITEAVARQNGYSGDMRRLPRARAAAIYRDLYWTAPEFDNVAKRAPLLAIELQDSGVNVGQAVATGFLQCALGAVDSCLRVRGVEGEEVLRKAIDALQGAHYIHLAELRPWQGGVCLCLDRKPYWII